jgi:hypothetical protein
MTIQEALLPLQENTDYRIEGNSLVALSKIRQVEQIIQHPEIAAVAAEAATEIIPATFDAEGIELTPMIPAKEAVTEVLFQAACEEIVMVDEVYFEVLPTLDEVKLSCISDVALAVSEYLVGKDSLRDVENDSINIVDNRIHSFIFSNIPQPSIAELYDSYLAAVAKSSQAAINAEALKYLADTDYMLLRELDGGTVMSAEVKIARAAARTRIIR